jgi:hypothetical protein
MDLRGQEIKNTYGNVVTVGSSAGAPTTGELTNGQNTSFTSTYLGGNFGIGSAPTTYGSLNVLGIGSAASAGGAIIDIVGTSGRLASIYTEASGKLVFTADPTNGEAGTSMEFNVDGSNAMFIDSSLRVGIGTTSGTSKANILSSTVAQTVLTLEGSSASSGSVELLEFSRSDGAVSGAIQYQDADTAMSIGTTTSHAFIFNTANAERMRITNAGNVGIGTTSPYAEMDIFQSTAGFGAWKYGLNLGATDFPALRFLATTANTGNIIAHEAGSLVFLSGTTNAAAGTERVRIDSSGNVGIGTTTPNTKLDVNGTINVRNNGYEFGRITTNNVSGVDGGLTFQYITGGVFTNGLLLDAAGNVGIGTTLPSQDLHVDGNVRITGAVYDSNNVAGTSGQVLSSTGTGTDWVSLSEISGVDGTGTANYISKWSDTDTITDSQIQDDGTTVGIGQAPSTAKLTVSGDIQTAAPETTTASAWKLGTTNLGGVFVATADYVTVEVNGFIVKLPIAIAPDTQDYYDRVISDGGSFEGVLSYESATTILKSN